MPGWTATTTKAPLNPPVTDDDGNKITEAVSVVEFDADAGGGIAPGQFQEFALSGGPFPDADSLTFPVVQTYSDGNESAWIEPTVEGQAEPEHPAPVLSLTGDPAGGGRRPPRPRRTADEHGDDPAAPAGGARCSWRSSRCWSRSPASSSGGRAARRTVSS